MNPKHYRSMFFLVAVVAIVGCSESPVVPVSGTISFPDREIPKVCRLTFVPIETAGDIPIRPNGGTMDEQGVYRLAAHKGVEGLLPGRYTIRLNYFDLKRNGNPDLDGDWKEFTFEAGELNVEAGSPAITHDIEVR